LFQRIEKTFVILWSAPEHLRVVDAGVAALRTDRLIAQAPLAPNAYFGAKRIQKDYPDHFIFVTRLRNGEYDDGVEV
jgi:hypothetical protein